MDGAPHYDDRNRERVQPKCVADFLPLAPSKCTCRIHDSRCRCHLVTAPPDAHSHHPWSITKTWSWLLLKHLLLIPFSHSGPIGCESALHALLNSEEKLNPINSSSMILCCFRVVRIRIATHTQAARSRRSSGFVSVLTALFQNATNFQLTPDDALAPRISIAHLSHVEASSRTTLATNLHFRRPTYHWRHRNICTTRRQLSSISNN